MNAAVDKINKDMEASDKADEDPARRADGWEGVLDAFSTYNKRSADEENAAGSRILDAVTASPRKRLKATGPVLGDVFDWVRSKTPDRAIPDTPLAGVGD